jgi:hypothetical protein
MLSGFENIIVKDCLRDLVFQIIDVRGEISFVNDNIAVISEILSGLDGTHVKDAI